MFERGEIVLIPVPFSDLSATKRRPVLVISHTAHNRSRRDMLVAAITSNLDADRDNTVFITTADLASGVLIKPSLVRGDKIYTLEQSIVIKRIGVISAEKLRQITDSIVELIS